MHESEGIKFTCYQGDEKELVLDEVNSYQRAIQHQHLAKPIFGAPSPPGFYVEVHILCLFEPPFAALTNHAVSQIARDQYLAGAYFDNLLQGVEGPQGRRALKLTRASLEEIALRLETQQQVKKDNNQVIIIIEISLQGADITCVCVILQAQGDKVREAAGFSAVLEMLRDSGKPAVGHNCAFDLTFTLEHLAQPLPHAWQAFKELVQQWFPGGANANDVAPLASLLQPRVSPATDNDQQFLCRQAAWVLQFKTGPAEPEVVVLQAACGTLSISSSSYQNCGRFWRALPWGRCTRPSTQVAPLKQRYGIKSRTIVLV